MAVLLGLDADPRAGADAEAACAVRLMTEGQVQPGSERLAYDLQLLARPIAIVDLDERGQILPGQCQPPDAVQQVLLRRTIQVAEAHVIHSDGLPFKYDLPAAAVTPTRVPGDPTWPLPRPVAPVGLVFGVAADRLPRPPPAGQCPQQALQDLHGVTPRRWKGVMGHSSGGPLGLRR